MGKLLYYRISPSDLNQGISLFTGIEYCFENGLSAEKVSEMTGLMSREIENLYAVYSSDKEKVYTRNLILYWKFNKIKKNLKEGYSIEQITEPLGCTCDELKTAVSQSYGSEEEQTHALLSAGYSKRYIASIWPYAYKMLKVSYLSWQTENERVYGKKGEYVVEKALNNFKELYPYFEDDADPREIHELTGIDYKKIIRLYYDYYTLYKDVNDFPYLRGSLIRENCGEYPLDRYFIKAYEYGFTTNELHDELGYSVSYIRSNDLKLKRKRESYTKRCENLEFRKLIKYLRCLDLHRKGVSYDDIGLKYGVAGRCIQNWLNKLIKCNSQEIIEFGLSKLSSILEEEQKLIAEIKIHAR